MPGVPSATLHSPILAPQGAPLVVAAFIRGSRAPHAQREAALAEVGRLVAAASAA